MMNSVKFRTVIIVPILVVIFALLLPVVVIAQDGKDGLVLYFSSGYGGQINPSESKTLYLEVSNNSNNIISGIYLSADAPEGWSVTFEPQNVGILEAGSYQAVEMDITAPKSVEKGSYSINVIADSSAGRRVIGTQLYVNKGNSIWIWVGGALGIVIIIVFVLIYRRFNKE